MLTIINRTLSTLIKQRHKIPEALTVILIFTILFTNEAIKVKDILLNKIQVVFPESFVQLLTKLQLSQKEVLTLWSFLLATFVITTTLDILGQLIKGSFPFTLEWGAEVLFQVNSIVLLLVLIYNSIHSPGIKISFLPINVYSIFLIICGCIFIALFLFYLCPDLGYLYEKIDNCDYAFWLNLALMATLSLLALFVLAIIACSLLTL